MKKKKEFPNIRKVVLMKKLSRHKSKTRLSSSSMTEWNKVTKKRKKETSGLLLLSGRLLKDMLGTIAINVGKTCRAEIGASTQR